MGRELEGVLHILQLPMANEGGIQVQHCPHKGQKDRVNQYCSAQCYDLVSEVTIQSFATIP